MTGPLNDSRRAQSHYDRELSRDDRRRRYQLDLVISGDISQLTEPHQRQSASEAGRLIDRLDTHKITWTDVCIAASQTLNHLVYINSNKTPVQNLKIKYVYRISDNLLQMRLLC